MSVNGGNTATSGLVVVRLQREGELLNEGDCPKWFRFIFQLPAIGGKRVASVHRVISVLNSWREQLTLAAYGLEELSGSLRHPLRYD